MATVPILYAKLLNKDEMLYGGLTQGKGSFTYFISKSKIAGEVSLLNCSLQSREDKLIVKF